jgi:hypothetical protein
MAPPVQPRTDSYVQLPPSNPGVPAIQPNTQVNVNRYEPRYLKPVMFGFRSWQDLEIGLTPAQSGAIYIWLSKIDNPQGVRNYSHGLLGRSAMRQVRNRVMNEVQSTPTQPVNPPVSDPNALDPNEINPPGSRIPYKPGQPEADDRPSPYVEPPVVAQPPDETVPDAPYVQPPGQPFPEATRGRAYYGVIQEGNYKGALGYFVFDPYSRTYKPRRVTPSEWAKIQAQPGFDQIMQGIIGEIGGPNFGMEVFGDDQSGGVLAKVGAGHNGILHAAARPSREQPSQRSQFGAGWVDPSTYVRAPSSRVRRSPFETGPPQVYRPPVAAPQAPGTRVHNGQTYTWNQSTSRWTTPSSIVTPPHVRKVMI